MKVALRVESWAARVTTMRRDDWFRRTTWSESDRQAFFERLRRSRSLGAKAQYIRIQASHLAETEHEGLVQSALELLEVFFTEYPDITELAQGHLQAANCYERLGDLHSAIRQFRLALETERQFPHSRTHAPFEFPWFIATHGLASLYDEALSVLDSAPRDIVFPINAFKDAAARALIAEARGEMSEAGRYAAEAVKAAKTDHSGLRYHKSLGLVGDQYDPMVERLRKLAAS